MKCIPCVWSAEIHENRRAGVKHGFVHFNFHAHEMLQHGVGGCRKGVSLHNAVSHVVLGLLNERTRVLQPPFGRWPRAEPCASVVGWSSDDNTAVPASVITDHLDHE